MVFRRNHCKLLYAGWSSAVALPFVHGAKINLKHTDFIASTTFSCILRGGCRVGTLNAHRARSILFLVRLLDIPPRSVHISLVCNLVGREETLEVTKALAALQPLYGKDNIEIVTADGKRVRGVVRSMKTTQALTTPSVKIECANGEIVKIRFPDIAEIKDHNGNTQ